MKIYPVFVVFLLCASAVHVRAQFLDDSLMSNPQFWQNYSTSSLEGKDPLQPVIITAIPQNGVWSNMGMMNAPLDIDFQGSLYRFQSTLNDRGLKLYTYDSGNVFFLVPGIYPENANQYEYRVVENAKKVIIPWSTIKNFTDFSLNDFKKGFAYLGGYKTTWGNYIIAEVRKKGADTAIQSAVVYWKEIHPVLQFVFTSKDLNDFLKVLKRSWDRSINYPPMPKDSVFDPSEKNLIFYMDANIYKKEALEYSVSRDGKVIVPWRANDFDNNFIWLKDLSYGNYSLQVRFARQRHNPSTYNFVIKPYWHQTVAFRAAMLILGLIFLFTIFLSLRYWRQRKKWKASEQKKITIENSLKAIRSQLNPHFVFNALGSIQSLVNQQKTTAANEYLTTFSSLLRETLRQNDREWAPLAVEIEMLKSYISLEQLRFRFQYDIIIDPNINIHTVETPALLLQPLVENAIGHGISDLKHAGRIRLQVSGVNQDMIIAIEDNGKGFDTQIPAKGYGLRLTRERINVLNQSLKNQKIHLDIGSTSSGTRVHLKFENWI